MNFVEKLLRASRTQNSLLCVGLDPEPSRFPPRFRGEDRELLTTHFCKAMIEATAPYACAYKPNIAFFEVLGPNGMHVLQEVIRAVPPNLPVILDAKRGDIGNTAHAYAETVFNIYECDAVTVNPYMGHDSLTPFLSYHDKGIFVLCRTSNAGARDLQDLRVQSSDLPDGQTRPLYEVVAQRVQSWNDAGNCGLVVGATYPHELGNIRAMCPDMPILIPGVGTQGGDLEASVQAGVDAHGERAILSVSRSILYASNEGDFATAAATQAKSLRDQINEARTHV